MAATGANERRSTRLRSGRFLRLGVAGSATMVAMLMVLAPAGSAATVHPGLTLTAPFLHTSFSPIRSSSAYGCAAAKAGTPHWYSATGGIIGFSSVSSRTCAKTVAVGGFNYGSSTDGLSIVIPFKVPSTGNHAIATSFNLNLASSLSFTIGGCPAKQVNYAPPFGQGSVGYCEAGASLDLFWVTSVNDLTNASWGSNSSLVTASNNSYWQNFTDCTNSGTPSCSNSTGTVWSSTNYSYNAPGAASLKWTGSTALTMWTNGTKMVKGDRYALVVSLTLGTIGFAYEYNLHGPWIANGTASMNMATLGHVLNLNSVTIF